jgi:NhaP-type Na+/H+ or K+/H+ antiporter
MNLSQCCVFMGGLLTILMGLFHTRFYKLFLWRDEFTRISERSRSIIYTIHLALLLLFFGLGAISLFYYRRLAEVQDISLGVLIVFALFWLWRAVWQAIYFKPSKNRRLRKYLIIHYLLIVWFMLLFIVYMVPLMIHLF